MKEDDGSLMTWEENFSAWWRCWQLSGGDDPLIKRDYALLDEIVPDRIESVEEWMARNKEWCMAVARGEMERRVLKLHEDRQLLC